MKDKSLRLIKVMRAFFIALFLAVVGNVNAQTYTYPLKGESGFGFSEKTRDGLRVDYNLKEFTLNQISYRGETMSEISISAIVFPNEEGYPDLPTESRFVAVPQGAEVTLEVIGYDMEMIPNVNIAPALRIQSEDEEPEKDYVKNPSVYQNNAFYPENPFSIDMINLRGVDAVALSVSPFQYNPVTQELRVYTNIQLALRYTGGNGHFGDDRLRSIYWDPILQQNLVNYDQLPVIDYEARMQEWINNRATGCEYLIVIPNKESFRTYANQLRDYRIAQGIKTEVKSLSEMGCSSIDQMKTYFHNAYNSWTIAPVAVLLLGDHNTNFSKGIPAETVSHPKGTCISDNGYADVNGDNLPDMVFSRLVAETPDEAEIMVSKQMDYEYLHANTSSSTYDHPVTACGWQTDRWFQLSAETVGGYWRNQGKHPVRINDICPDSSSPGDSWSSANNTTTVVNYFGPNGVNYIPARPSLLGGWSGGTGDDVVDAVNNGTMMLQHRDHGSIYGWCQPDFTTYEVEDLTNVGKLTFFNSINCKTGKFDEDDDCFVEALMRYTYNGQNAGAVGCIGATQTSYSYANDIFVWGMFDYYDPSFMPNHSTSVNSNYQSNWMPAFGSVAGKHLLSQSSWYNNSSIKTVTYNMFTAHCDAFLRLYTTVPMTISSSAPSHISATTTSISVTAPSGAMIALTCDNNILALAIGTGGSKTITFNAQPAGTNLKLVITKQNYLRKEMTIRVDGGAPSVVSCSVPSISDNSATLKAQIIPGGASASYYFKYGTTDAYGQQTSTSQLSASNDPSYVTATINNLQPNTEYHFCIRVENSYGGISSDDNMFTTTGSSNNPPTKPSNPTPANGATNVPENQTLSWNSTDPDGGGVWYDLYLGSSSSNLHLERSGSGTSCANIGFAAGTTYFWKVVSKDSENASISGPVWSFTTTTNTHFQINASANPSAGGTVTGSGAYTEEQLCTVTALANSGYTFLKWTENGTEVSTSPSYTFTVSNDRTLVAVFASTAFVSSLSDDFNDGVVNSAKWIPNGSDVVEEDGLLKMNQNLTDDNVSLLSAPMHAGSNNQIVMERKFIVHKSNSYFYGGYAFEFNGSTGVHGMPYNGAFDATVANTAGVDYISVIYCHTNFEEKYGIYVETGIGSDAHGTRICDAVFDTWQTERVVVDLSAGTLSYYLDNTFITTMGIPGLQALPVNYYTTIFRPWGWAEGHYHYIDYVNINTPTSYSISANASPTGGGIIAGAGNYQGGTVCTLTATSNPNYSFVNWTENGTEISTSAIYSFAVTGSRELTANFSSNGYVVTAVASPSSGGSVSGGGVFNAGATCSLSATANNGYTFVNWTMNGMVVSTSPTYSFTVNQDATYVANFSNGGFDITHTAILPSGWTWWSTYVEQQNSNGLAQMEQTLGDAGITIKSQANGFVTNSGNWYGSLNGINNESTYLIQTNSACQMSVTGVQASTAAHPINLPTGWTWLGYPCATSMSVGTALSGLTPVANDQLKSQQGFAVYTPGVGWLGSLNTVTSGMGLMFESHSTSPVTLTYPSVSKSEDVQENITSRGNHWEPEVERYPDNMSVMAVVELDGEELVDESCELAAFADGECRGSVGLIRVDALGRYMAFLTVYGEAPAELSFVLYDRTTGKEILDSPNHLVFGTNTTVGSPMEPYTIRFFDATTGIVEFDHQVKVFPNPVAAGHHVNLDVMVETEIMQVDVINTLGVVERVLSVPQQSAIIQAPNTAGVYILRITVDGKGTCYRRLVVN